MTDGLTASDVAVLTGGTGKNDGFGGDWGAWIILFLIFGMFGWGGFGGWGGNGGGANSPAFQGYATRADIDAALSTQGIENGIQNLSGPALQRPCWRKRQPVKSGLSDAAMLLRYP